MKGKNYVSKKVVILLLAAVLLIGGAIGGTLAWLITSTNTVTNTFVSGDIEIDLKETVNGVETSAKTTAVSNENFKMIPGTDLAKDPKVIVEANSEACWLFVKVEASDGVELSGNSDVNDYITYTMADGWSPVTGVDGVYYRQVNSADAAAGKTYQILAGNAVHVLDTVTEAMLETAETKKPSLKFSAYAIQSDNLKKDGTAVTDAAVAWSLISN